MTDQLKKQLAEALDISPDQIKRFKRTAQAGDYHGRDEYTVILNNYQKFVRVTPHQPADVAEDGRLPDPLQAAYDNPHSVNKPELIKVCKALGIKADGVKGDLIDRIIAHRS